MTTSDPAERPIARLLRAQQQADPDAIVETLLGAVSALGGSDVLLYLVDYGHTTLMPHPDMVSHDERAEPAPVDTTMAGRAFITDSALAAQREDGWHVWVPVRERANKLGVLAMTLPDWNADVEYLCVELGLAAAHLVISSAHYTDLPHLLRRRQDMDLAAELQWSLLPPLAFATNGTSIAGMLEPAYEVGGDCFDYALNDGVLDLAVFDAVGHGLISSVLACLVTGAYRHGRRAGEGLLELAMSVDAATRTFPGSHPFATALLARLDVASGRLSWLSCGHPQPIIVRGAATLADVEPTPCLPLGLGDLAPVHGTVVDFSLEPGDGVLLYTDGVVETRDASGAFFGEDRLRDLLGREHHTGGAPQEVVRRLVRSTLSHAGEPLQDDATLLYLRWDGEQATD